MSEAANEPNRRCSTWSICRCASAALMAVDDVSFTASGAKSPRIIGPNGAGKTTVFNCLTGFYRPSVGQLALAREGKMLALERMDGLSHRARGRAWRALSRTSACSPA